MGHGKKCSSPLAALKWVLRRYLGVVFFLFGSLVFFFFGALPFDSSTGSFVPYKIIRGSCSME